MYTFGKTAPGLSSAPTYLADKKEGLYEEPIY